MSFNIAPNPNMPHLTVDLDDQGRFVLTATEPLTGQVSIQLPAEVQEKLHQEAAALLGQDAGRETDMEVQVTRHRWANMGDHAVLATEAVQYDPTETVEALVLRVLNMRAAYQRHDSMDHVVLRVVEGTEPERNGSNVPPF